MASGRSLTRGLMARSGQAGMCTVLSSSSSWSTLPFYSCCNVASHQDSSRSGIRLSCQSARTNGRSFLSSLADGSRTRLVSPKVEAWREHQTKRSRGGGARVSDHPIQVRGFARSSTLMAAKSLDKVMMKELSVQCVIGCNPEERDVMQELVISVSVFTDLRKSLGEHVKKCDILDEMKLRAQSPDWASHAASELAGTHNYSSLAKIARRIAEEGKFFTIEALAECIAREVIVECNARRVTIGIDKPAALRKKGARAAAVEITRDREDFIFTSTSVLPEQVNDRSIQEASLNQVSAQHAATTEPMQLYPNVAMIALGSNVGDRPQNIQAALKHLEKNKCQVLATSFLYESPASYVTNQPSFVNAACKIATTHGPDELLGVLKSIEKEVGRQERFRWGPREVDLDILFYNHSVYENTDRTLTIPHPRLCERDFVLGPLCDIEPGWIHPVQKKPVVQILKELLQSQQTNRCTLTRIFPLKLSRSTLRKISEEGSSSADFMHLTSKRSYTSIMGILNVTPDSFSDGNKFFDLQSAIRQFKDMVAAGADIIDVGGQSTRPNAKYLEAEEELERVLPLIEAVRREGIGALISVDTFHSEVARKAIEAGADMINDVSGGLLDAKMLEVAAALNVPICLMHYRGNAASMQQLCNYPEDLVAAVASELRSQCNAAMKAGVAKWNIIVDPGLGFAKTSEQSVAVLRNARRFRELTSPFGDGLPQVPPREELSLDRAFPLLIGPSRKSFIGSILQEKDAASERRVWGTAASCTVAVEQGANFLRVHDVKEMKDVAAIADAIYRSG